MSGTFVTVYTSEPDTMKMKNYNIQRRGVLIMKCIGIIGAMEQEVAKIKEKMQDVTITSRARMDFYEGTLEGKKVVVVRSGIGKVNAGMCTQILADVFGVEAVINTGIAVDFLVQGTIYPDVVESGVGGESTVIKSHHNVGGLPDYVDFKEIIEPLRNLFKDEVRKAGLELGIPKYLVFRQPFPGPGLGIRIIGEVTAEKVKMVQDADAIWREEIDKAGIAHEIGQYFAALTNMRSVGVMGDERTYDYAIALRAVTTTDFMTAESAEIPWDVIGKTTSRIVNEVKHINRVMYDCTGKPPATIEFE